jgi:homoserine dehydrogenase
MNAVLVKGDAVGPTLYYGAGAGAEPTASAVVADIIDVTRALTSDPEHRVPHLAFQPSRLSSIPVLTMDDVKTAYYLRMAAMDKPGVVSQVTGILGDLGISIEAIQQKEPAEDAVCASLVMLTQPVFEKNMKQAIHSIEALNAIEGKVVMIRVEHLDGK